MTQSTGMTMDLSAGGKGEVVVNETDDSGLPTPAAMSAADAVNTDPDAVNAITARVLATEKADDPVMTVPPLDGRITLAAGYVTPDGERVTEVQLRELRGRDEEAMSKALSSGDVARYVDTIVRCGVERIGDDVNGITDEKELRAALNTLLIGDRAQIVLEIRRLAYGDTMEMSLTCPFCDEAVTVEYSYGNDVPMKPFSVPGETDLARRSYDVKMPSGKTAKIRLIDGAAQKAVYTPDNLSKKSDEERNTMLLTELVESIDGRPVVGNRQILDQTSKDRRCLLKWVTDTQPGPEYDKVEQECAGCSRSYPVGEVSLYQMFRGE